MPLYCGLLICDLPEKMLAGLLALVLCLGAMAGCSSDAGNESAPAESPSEAITDAVESGEIDGAKVGVLVVSTQSQWCNDLIAGVTEVCEANGMQVIVSDSQVSVDQEIAGMENLINAGCDAIVVNCMNAAGLADLCQQAQDQGSRGRAGRVRHGGGGHRELYRRKGPGSA